MAKSEYVEKTIYTQFSADRPYIQEKMDAKNTRVERAGYIPAKKRLKAIMLSGERLAQARRELYHYGANDNADPFYDPSIDPSLDPVDIAGATQAITAELEAKADSGSENGDDTSGSGTVSDLAEGSVQTEVVSDGAGS